MNISAFDLFSIGIGPSSSHTVGPMKAANAFIVHLAESQQLGLVQRILVELYGSLALTGKGHGTDNAMLNGLVGEKPDTVDPVTVLPRAQQIIATKQLNLTPQHSIPFDFDQDFLCHYKELLPLHANGLRLSAFAQAGNLLFSQVYYSVGGGFIVTPEEFGKNTAAVAVPYPFNSAKELLQLCAEQHLSIAEIVLANEQALHPGKDIRQGLLKIAEAMSACIESGCHTRGVLPGGLKVKRRAADLYEKMQQATDIAKPNEHVDVMHWLNIYAMAVNEENAGGGRIVTAPTNGAAGVLPAVLTYYHRFQAGANAEGVVKFLLTASAIAMLCKKNASISGAEVGCQGEVGSASAMAAAGFAAVLGGTPAQIENAAEIALEHHLGMTCDPIAGLVQIPCIERNAMGAVKAVNAARLALAGDGSHHVSLDKAIATMRQTGKDMLSIYKETSLGGLAANIPEC